MILFSTLSQGWQAWLFCYLGFVSGLLFFATMFFANLLTKKNKLKTISPKYSTKTNNSTQTCTKTCSLSTKDVKNTIIAQKNDNNQLINDKNGQKDRKINIFRLFNFKKHKKMTKKNKENENVSKNNKTSENIQIIDKKEENKTKNSNKSVKNINKSDKSSKNNKKRVQNEKKKKKRQILKKKLCTFFTILWKFVINFATEIVAIFILGAVVFASLLINLKLNYGSLPPVCIALWILSFVCAKFFLKTLAKFFVSIYNKYVKRKKANGNITL